jgi:hypothetical protein
VETLGPFGEEGTGSSHFIECSVELRSNAYLTKRISIAIQRGNAANIFSTVPISSKVQEIYKFLIDPCQFL